MADTSKYWHDGGQSNNSDSDNSSVKYWYEGGSSSEVGTSDQTITGSSGIGSDEVFGSGGTVTPSNTLAGSAGIPSDEAFGSGGIVNLTITGSAGIDTSEAFGSGGVVINAQNITGASGIASSEVFGSGGYVIYANIQGFTGIASSEAFGSGGTVTGPIVGDTGIGSSEAFGAGGIVSAGITGVAGIPSAEAFGIGGVVAGLLGTAGIPSDETFGSGGIVAGAITGAIGIASSEAFGSGGQVQNDLTLTGITGIASSEAFGVDGTVAHLYSAAGIPSDETFGSGGTVTNLGTQTLTGSAGTASSETFGSGGTLTHGLGGYEGIASSEVFGLGGMVISGLLLVQGPFYVYIDGVDRSNYLACPSVKVTDNTGSRSTASFTLVDPAGLYRPELGSEVIILFRPIFNDAASIPVKVYGGYLITMEEAVEPSTTATKNSCTCADYGFKLDRRTFTYNVIEGTTVSTALQALDQYVLREEGITYIYTGDPGITMPAKAYDAIIVSDFLNEMSRATGWDWKVDRDRALYFDRNPVAIARRTCPFTFTESNEKYRTISVRREIGKYTNSQTMRLGGSDRTPFRTDTFVGTGTQRDFNVSIEMLEAPTSVQVNGVEYTIAPLGAYTTGWQVAWQASGRLIRFSTSDIPAAAASIVVTYPSDASNVLTVTNTGQITAVQAVMGNSGRFDAVVMFPGESGSLNAMGDNLMSRGGDFADPVVNVETDEFGIEVGQIVTVAATYPPAADDYTVLSHSWEELGKQRIRSRVTIGPNGKQGSGFGDLMRDRLGGGGGGGYGGGYTPSNSTYQGTAGTAVSNGGAPVRYVFNIAASQPGCTNAGMLTGAVSIPEIICYPGVIKEVQAFLGVHVGNRQVIVDVRLNGVSIFKPTTRVVFSPRASATPNYSTSRFNSFVVGNLVVRTGDLLTCVVIQTGSSAAVPTGDQLGHDGKVSVIVM